MGEMKMKQKTNFKIFLFVIFAIWILTVPVSAAQVHLTLNVHDGSDSGPPLAGVHITGTDGVGTSFDVYTNAAGSVGIDGYQGTWQFTAFKSGYTTNSWPQDITYTQTRNASLTTTPGSPLAESPHPTAGNYQNTWIISESTAAQMRLHFTKVELAYGDSITITDGTNKFLTGYGASYTGEDFWTPWYATNTMKVTLATAAGNKYGFLINS